MLTMSRQSLTSYLVGAFDLRDAGQSLMASPVSSEPSLRAFEPSSMPQPTPTTLDSQAAINQLAAQARISQVSSSLAYFLLLLRANHAAFYCPFSRHAKVAM